MPKNNMNYFKYYSSERRHHKTIIYSIKNGFKIFSSLLLVVLLVFFKDEFSEHNDMNGCKTTINVKSGEMNMHN